MKKQSPVWHPYSRYGIAEPLFIESAQKEFLITADGVKVIDAISSWWTNIHGHSNKQLSKVAAQQTAKLDHVIFAGFTHEPAETLASQLVSIIPGKPEKIFFSDNGSTAVEVAIKMALQYHTNQGQKKKKKIVVLEGSYHGDTFGAMSVSERSAFTDPFRNYLFDVISIPFPDKVDRSKLKKILDGNDIAAFIYEPLVLGTAGMKIYSAESLNEILTLFKKADVLCIADEVMTGFGRTGKLFASDYVKVKPDIVCLSKGITGGVLPLGVTSANRKVYDAFRSTKPEHTFYHGHSYTGNPVSCAIAVKSLELLRSKDSTDSIKNISNAHKGFVGFLRKEFNTVISNADSLGTILSIGIKTNEPGYFFKGRDAAYVFFLNRNILIRPLGNVIYVMPPYCISARSLNKVYDAVSDFLRSLKNEN